MKRIKKNIIFIILLLAAVVCIIMRNNELTAPIVSHPDSGLVFSTDQKVLEQTWQPHIKKIAGVKIPYTGTADFNSRVYLSLYTDDYSELLVRTSLDQEFKENAEGTLTFRFKALRVMPGERYRIQLSYEEPSGEGALLIASGSNYDGCSIDREECNEAAAFEIIFIKNSRIFWMLAVFFPFFSFSLLFMTIWNRKWEECIGLSMIITVFLLYAAGLFEALTAGMVMVYVLALIALSAAIYFYNKKDLQAKDLLSPGLFIYAALFLFILVNCHNIWFARVDEYAQWGMAVKDMFYYQSFAKHIGTTVQIPRYLPFSTLIEYFFVYANGMFSQELVYVAYQTFMMSALMVLLGVAGEKKRYYVACAAIMIGMPVIFYSDAFNCIMVDPLLAILAAYVLICYYSEDMSFVNLIRILGGLFALTTTKDMGMVIAGLLTVIMMGDRLYLSLRQKDSVIKRLICPCLCAVFVIVVFLSWQIYMSIPAKAAASQTSGSGSSQVSFQSTASATGISVDGISGLLRHEDGGYRYQAIKNFLIEIFDGEFLLIGNIGISYVDLFVLLIFLIGGLGLIGFWRDRAGRMLSFGVFSFLAGMCYASVIELMYLFAFPQGEALLLVSIDRYLASFMGGVMIALAGLAVQQAAKKETENPAWSLAVITGLTAAILISTPISGFVVKNMDVKITEDLVYGYDDVAEVFRSFSAKAEKVYFVCNGSNGDTQWIFKNTVCPLLSPYAQYDIYDSREAYLEQVAIWTQDGEEIADIGQVVSCEKWEERLFKCQYLFIFHPNDVFRESYGSLFAEPDTIGDGTFYRVRQSDEKVTLEYIGKVGVKNYK